MHALCSALPPSAPTSLVSPWDLYRQLCPRGVQEAAELKLDWLLVNDFLDDCSSAEAKDKGSAMPGYDLIGQSLTLSLQVSACRRLLSLEKSPTYGCSCHAVQPFFASKARRSPNQRQDGLRANAARAHPTGCRARHGSQTCLHSIPLQPSKASQLPRAPTIRHRARL